MTDRVLYYREQINADQAALRAIAYVIKVGIDCGADTGKLLAETQASLQQMADSMKEALERTKREGDPPLKSHESIEEVAVSEMAKTIAFREQLDRFRRRE